GGGAGGGGGEGKKTETAPGHAVKAGAAEARRPDHDANARARSRPTIRSVFVRQRSRATQRPGESGKTRRGEGSGSDPANRPRIQFAAASSRAEFGAATVQRRRQGPHC